MLTIMTAVVGISFSSSPLLAGKGLPCKGLRTDHIFSEYKRDSRGPLLNYKKYLKNKHLRTEIFSLLMGDDRDAAINSIVSTLLDLDTLSKITTEYFDGKTVRLSTEDNQTLFYGKKSHFLRIIEIDQSDLLLIENFVDRCQTLDGDSMRFQKDKLVNYQLDHFFRDQLSKLRGVRFQLPTKY